VILVVGDSMLDRYWEGTVERISPEAPVPILKVTREFCRPGGAANVAANVAALGSPVSLLTVMGLDEPGRKLRALLDGVAIHAVGSRTTQKIRCVAQRQQMIRTDFEEVPSDIDVGALGVAFKPAANRIAVFSDYGKGALRDVRGMLAQARKVNCRTLVDPKGTDFDRYTGAWLLKPNEAETRAVVGDWYFEDDFRARCQALRDRLGVDYLLVTRGERGMTLFNESITDYAAERREVFDVSGAGDTVLATLSHFVGKGLTVPEACFWANKAAGVVVGKFGTASVTAEELA
jgi:rfaE bifunctional protein kinase chain/domain